MPVTPDNSTHIGDGVYAEPDRDGGVILRTERTDDHCAVCGGRCVIEHWIALDRQTWAALARWMASKEAEHRRVLAAICEDYAD